MTSAAISYGNIFSAWRASNGALGAWSGLIEPEELADRINASGVSCTLDAEVLDTENGSFIYTASSTTAKGALEVCPANNADSYTDRVGLFVDSMQSEEP